MVSNEVYRLCYSRIELGDEYKKHCHAEAMNEVYKRISECLQQTIE